MVNTPFFTTQHNWESLVSNGAVFSIPHDSIALRSASWGSLGKNCDKQVRSTNPHGSLFGYS